MRFRVSAPFRAEFLDSEDLTGSGIKVISGRAEGELDALDEEDAAAQARAQIEERYPVRWKLRHGRATVEPAADPT